MRVSRPDRWPFAPHKPYGFNANVRGGRRIACSRYHQSEQVIAYKRQTVSRENVSSSTSQNYERSFASTMQFTAKFTTLACAVVAAMVSQVTASPALVRPIVSRSKLVHKHQLSPSRRQVEAGSSSKDLQRADTTDANITYVGRPSDSAPPGPYVFVYAAKFTESRECTDLGPVTVLSQGQCTPIRFGLTAIQCIQDPTSVPLQNVMVCTTSACDDCYNLGTTPTDDGFRITTNVKYIKVMF